MITSKTMRSFLSWAGMDFNFPYSKNCLLLFAGRRRPAVPVSEPRRIPGSGFPIYGSGIFLCSGRTLYNTDFCMRLRRLPRTVFSDEKRW